MRGSSDSDASLRAEEVCLGAALPGVAYRLRGETAIPRMPLVQKQLRSTGLNWEGAT